MGAVHYSGPAAEMRGNPWLRDELLGYRLQTSDNPYHQREKTVPFVNIQILKGHPQDRKNEIASRVTAAISQLAQLPKEAILVVFEDVAAEDWYVGAEPVSELKKRAAQK